MRSFRSKPIGWRKESYRHYLASKGVKTNYYAKRKISGEDVKKTVIPEGTPTITRGQRSPDPKKLLERLKLIPKIEAEVREQAYAETDVARAISGLKSNNPTNALLLLNSNQMQDPANPGKMIPLTPYAREAIIAQISEYAIRARKAGVPAETLESYLSKEQLAAVKERGMTPEEELKRARRRDIAISAGEAPVLATEAAAEAVAGTTAAGIRAEAEFLGEAFTARAKPFPGGPGTAQDFPGVFEVAPEVAKLPFFTQNVVVGNEEQNDLSLPTHLSSVNVPKLSEAWSNIPEKSGYLDNIRMAPTSDEEAKEVSRKVDMLNAEKNHLANGRLNAYQDGVRAFKKGKREELLNAISELKSEEQKLRDRAGIVEQVRNQAMGSAMQAPKPSGNFVLDGGVESGARRLVEHTDKMSEVREALKKNYDQVYLRRRDLEFKLQRMDAQFKPEVGAPKKVQKFGDDEAGLVPSFKGVKNPIVKLRVRGKEE